MELDPAKAFARDSSSRLFYDKNGDDVWQAADEGDLMDETSAFKGIRVTPLLTVWRKLHVEVDSMGAPPAGTVFPDDGMAIDVDPGDMPAPDTGLLTSAFEPAFVQVLLGTAYDNGDAAFAYHLANTNAALEAQGAPHRGLGESLAYWSAYVQAAYESETAIDNDPDAEDGTDGLTSTREPEYSFVFLEVLRDLTGDDHPTWSRSLVEQRTVAHEIGHQFGLTHANDGPMHESTNPSSRTSAFDERDLKIIRSISSQ